MDEKLYQECKANGTCYFCGKTGHMISQCNARKKQEGTKGKGKGGGKPKYTSNTIEVEETEPETLEEYLESLHTISRPTPKKKTIMTIAGKPAEVLLDTGTVGTNLMSLAWAQSNGIKTTELKKPLVIGMATKNSRTTANYSVQAEVDIGKGRNVTCDFLLVPIGSYDVILGTRARARDSLRSLRTPLCLHVSSSLPWVNLLRAKTPRLNSTLWPRGVGRESPISISGPETIRSAHQLLL